MKGFWKIIKVNIVNNVPYFVLLVAVGIAAAESGRRQAVYDMYNSYRRQLAGVAEISVQDALALAGRQKILLVDVRRPAERQVSMLPGAVSEDEIRRHPELAAGKTIVVYCTIGYRSGLAVRRMAERGRAAVNLKGGILAWVHEGGRVVDADGPTRRVHVFGRQWNLLPDGYEPVMFGWWTRLFSP